MHPRWLAGLRFAQAAHHIVLEDYIQTVEAARATARPVDSADRGDVAGLGAGPVVAALQTMRGMALINAATLIAEPGDLSRFANPRQLTASLGLVPSEQSSGASVTRAGITKRATERRAGC